MMINYCFVTRNEKLIMHGLISPPLAEKFVTVVLIVKFMNFMNFIMESADTLY